VRTLRAMRAAIPGGEVFYEIVGSGTALFVVHGGPGIDHTCFRPWLDPLGDVARVVYSDLLGNGRSDRVALHGGMETWADGVDALRARLGIETIVLFGHSFGGFVAIEYALRHRERLRGLVLCATGPGFAPTEVLMANARARAAPAELAAVEHAFATAPTTDAELRASHRAVLPLYFHRRDARILEAMDAQTHYSAAAVAYGLGECFENWTGGERANEITTPTLVVSGAHDWIMPPRHAGERLHAAIAGSRHVVMNESGHIPFIEEQHAFLDVERDWLATLA
jgi:proline iminopeptidase